MAKDDEKVGLRGFEALAFVSFVAVLLVISLVTTIASLFIIYKLRLIPSKEAITFAHDSVVFHGDTDLDRVYLSQNQINGVSSLSGNLDIEAGSSSVKVTDEGIQFASDNGLQVRSRASGELIFPLDFNKLKLSAIPSLALPGGAKDVNKIRSPIDQDLGIYARDKIKIRGNEGIDIESKRIELDSSYIYLSSVNSSIILDGKEGVQISIKNLAKAGKEDENMELQYKLCICGKTGRVFKLQLRNPTQTCADVRFPELTNPCV